MIILHFHCYLCLPRLHENHFSANFVKKYLPLVIGVVLLKKLVASALKQKTVGQKVHPPIVQCSFFWSGQYMQN